MMSRSRASLAATVLVPAVLTAAPARAGGPLQPPDGAIAGFRIHYRIPPVLSAGRCLRVACWSLSHDDVAVRIELWNDGADPNRDPVLAWQFDLDVTRIEDITLCPGPRVVGRIVAAPIKKLSIECSAEVVDDSNGQTISTLPLSGPPKRKKR
jgi:hypothetical protein